MRMQHDGDSGVLRDPLESCLQVGVIQLAQQIQPQPVRNEVLEADNGAGLLRAERSGTRRRTAASLL